MKLKVIKHILLLISERWINSEI